MARVTAEQVLQTRKGLLEAARKVLIEEGYAGLSTRRVAEAADTRMSQIQYHFGSKEGMILALFEYLNAGLVERQRATFDDPSLSVSRKWVLACDYLDEDLASGYVRVLQELIAAGWSTPAIGDIVREALGQWHAVLTDLARQAMDRHGGAGPFTPEGLAALIASAFVGAEALILLGYEEHVHGVRTALRQVGEVIAEMEQATGEG